MKTSSVGTFLFAEIYGALALGETAIKAALEVIMRVINRSRS